MRRLHLVRAPTPRERPAERPAKVIVLARRRRARLDDRSDKRLPPSPDAA